MGAQGRPWAVVKTEPKSLKYELFDYEIQRAINSTLWYFQWHVNTFRCHEGQIITRGGM